MFYLETSVQIKDAEILKYCIFVPANKKLDLAAQTLVLCFWTFVQPGWSIFLWDSKPRRRTSREPIGPALPPSSVLFQLSISERNSSLSQHSKKKRISFYIMGANHAHNVKCTSKKPFQACFSAQTGTSMCLCSEQRFFHDRFSTAV